MKRRKESRPRHKRIVTEKASIIPAILEKSDLAWELSKYRKQRRANPNQTLLDFLMNRGINGLLLRLWFSVDRLFRFPENYICVWHGTSLNRAVRILERGFRFPVYTSFEPDICLEYAKSRAYRESDSPALIASVLEQWYVQKRVDAFYEQGYVIFRAFPSNVTQFIFIPPERWATGERSPLETWQILTHTPGLIPPSQNELDILLDDWDFESIGYPSDPH
jgi:hypothetical protein